MNKPPPAPEPLAKTLTAQQSDFTAEGSPPPGQVSTTVPVLAPLPGPAGKPPAKRGAGAKRLPHLTPEVHP